MTDCVIRDHQCSWWSLITHSQLMISGVILLNCWAFVYKTPNLRKPKATYLLCPITQCQRTRAESPEIEVCFWSSVQLRRQSRNYQSPVFYLDKGRATMLVFGFPMFSCGLLVRSRWAELKYGIISEIVYNKIEISRLSTTGLYMSSRVRVKSGSRKKLAVE